MNEFSSQAQNDIQVREAARKLYDPNLAYHNFEHALAAIDRSTVIIENCKREGLEVDEAAVYYALLFHDAGYHQNPHQFGFKTKERYAAHLAYTSLTTIGIDEKTVAKAVDAIQATEKDGHFNSIEAKIVRASDLAGLAADYEKFLEANVNLRIEHVQLTGTMISWDEWKQKTTEVVEYYLRQDIHLTKAYEDSNGESIFHTKAKQNLERLMSEPEPA